MRETILSQLQPALTAIGIDEIPQLSRTANQQHGDWATNIALKCAGSKKMSPLQLAKNIAENIKTGDIITRVTVAAPGFINITLSEQALRSSLTQTPQKVAAKDTVLIEFGQPNTHKSPHIGHLFSYIYGESLARIYEKNGSRVIRANYQGDIGLHVAKCLWAMKQDAANMDDFDDSKSQMTYLQSCYQKGAAAYDAAPAAKEEIDAVNRALYDQRDQELVSRWMMTRQWCVDYYKEFEESLGIRYDKSYFETDIAELGLDLVKKHVPQVFSESDGAVIFKGEDVGLHTRVFINKHHNPTYEAKEVGLAFQKNKDFTFDQAITTTASEQNEYMKVVYRAIELIDPTLRAKLVHLGFGMINLSTGKMSSRTGNIVTAFSLVDDVTQAIIGEYGSEPEQAQIIALAAIKYAFLKSDYRANKSFNIATSVAREGDSGPYILYTYVRTQSVSRQSNSQNHQNVSGSNLATIDNPLHDDERALILLLQEEPDIIETAKRLHAPHIIAGYAYSVAQAYNAFYQSCPILKADASEKEFRLVLSERVGQVLARQLHLLGIQTVDEM